MQGHFERYRKLQKTLHALMKFPGKQVLKTEKKASGFDYFN